jgi:formate C-acetyltransferase
MYYIWHSKDMPATPDGRNKGEEFAANYSPSIYTRCKGPVSIIKSFTKPDLKRVINGGPLTLELHDTVFRTPEAVSKVALLVKSFMDLGGHQLQLNSINRDTLLDAQKHPEKHRNLIVRVWGWSGYFVELSKEYQDHIIKRTELSI